MRLLTKKQDNGIVRRCIFIYKAFYRGKNSPIFKKSSLLRNYLILTRQTGCFSKTMIQNIAAVLCSMETGKWTNPLRRRIDLHRLQMQIQSKTFNCTSS